MSRQAVRPVALIWVVSGGPGPKRARSEVQYGTGGPWLGGADVLLSPVNFEEGMPLPWALCNLTTDICAKVTAGDQQGWRGAQWFGGY